MNTDKDLTLPGGPFEGLKVFIAGRLAKRVIEFDREYGYVDFYAENPFGHSIDENHFCRVRVFGEVTVQLPS